MALTSSRFATNTRLLAASENRPSLKVGERGEAVAIVQMALIDLGFAMPNSTAGGKQLPDGVFGPETNVVVRSFQAQNGLTVDGTVGRQTLAVLESLIVVQSKQRASVQTIAMRLRPASH
jgi:peptidoglycan hydrolase-like protein with peptidoglycan-binding domain